jgi:cell division initiation protein
MRSDDIVKARFSKAFRGYDVQEVDLFLDEIIRTLDELEQERNILLTRIDALLTQLEEYDALFEKKSPGKAD